MDSLNSSTADLRRRAFQMLVLCTAFWGLSFPAMKAITLTQQGILPEAGSWFITSVSVMLRFSIAGVILLLFTFREFRRVTRLEVEQGALLALFTTAGLMFQMDGLAYTSASTSAFLTQCYCFLIPLWLALVARRWPAAKILVCIALVLVGMAVLVDLNPLSLKLGRGEIETLICSVMFTGQILCLEHPRYRANRPMCLTTVMLLATGLFSLPVVLLTAPGVAQCFQIYASPAVWGFMAIIIVFCTLGSFVLMNRWQRHLAATEAGLIYCAEPVFVSALALFLPGIFSAWAAVDYANEHLTTRLLVGGGLITAANILLQSPWMEPKPAGCSKG